MKPIIYIDRETKKRQIEKVYGEPALKFLYGKSCLARLLKNMIAKSVIFSMAYGFFMKSQLSRYKIRPFIEKYGVDPSEFEQKLSSFYSFNDFFIRKIKKKARPIHQSPAVIPADGRYFFYQNIEDADGFIVKGKKWSLSQLLQDTASAKEYEKGAMVIARLCPVDYHRFHFPVSCTPSLPQLINGYLYSVNPLAVRQNIHIFTENKRVKTVLNSSEFGKVIFMEIGATNVGSIHQTFQADHLYQKGDEKGFFSFGGSALVLLFKENTISFDQDLILATQKGLEIKCLMGQSMGVVC